MVLAASFSGSVQKVPELETVLWNCEELIYMIEEICKSSCFQFFCTASAALMLFLTVLMNLSVSAFARGHRGVIFRCLMPMFDMYVLNSELLNGGPLSVFTCSGRPNSEKILSRRGIIARADVL